MPPLTSSGTGKIIIHNNENEDDIIKVKTSRLDDFVDSFNNVKLISIDTEGHEPFVLEGSKEVIVKNRPVIIIEVSPKLLRKFANSTPQHIYYFFEELKYCVHRINKFSFSNITESDCQSNQASNWLCIPEELKEISLRIKRNLFIRTLLPWYILKTLPNKK